MLSSASSAGGKRDVIAHAGPLSYPTHNHPQAFDDDTSDDHTIRNQQILLNSLDTTMQGHTLSLLPHHPQAFDDDTNVDHTIRNQQVSLNPCAAGG